MKRYKKEIELNRIEMPLSDFLESYNQNIPASFPCASVTALKKFQLVHPMLFKNGNTWSVALHRKKLIDWLFGNHDIS